MKHTCSCGGACAGKRAVKPALALRQDGKIISLPSCAVDTPEARLANKYARYLLTADLNDYVNWFIMHRDTEYVHLVEGAVKILREAARVRKAKAEKKGRNHGEAVPRSRKGKGRGDG